MTSQIYPLTLYYESACVLCDTEMRALRARNRDDRLRFVDVSAPGFQPPDDASLPAMLTAIHGRRADGTWVRGMDTVRLAYAAIGLGWLVAPTRWPVLRPLADAAYAWFARHRHALPRWVVRAKVAVLTQRADPELAREAREAAARARCTDSTCSR